MQHFIGTKRLLAQPMNRADYNSYRGWELPKDEDGSDAGYLVEYLDGGKPNDDRHGGYISWSPQDVFERAYKQYDDDFVGRMRLESDQLQERFDKLSVFLDGELSPRLSDDQLALLNSQRDSMRQYLDVLVRRLAAETARTQRAA